VRSLIVDDSQTIRKLIFEMLSALGDCDMAKDGVEALDYFHQSLTEAKPYNVICLDLIMPNIDGQAVLREIRETERGLGITFEDRSRIIIITSQGDLTNVLKAAHWKADGFLVKPFKREQLFLKLKELGLSVVSHVSSKDEF
jgi:two-component system chemotaxis response regulator CheY